MNELYIAAKMIGSVNMPNFCPRCFWLKLQTKKLPYQTFPGIFSSIDSYTKKITKFYFDKHGKVPPWFDRLGLKTLLDTPTMKTFKVQHEKTGIWLQGIPDDVFKKDNSYAIGDYKTARHTKNADVLMPIYDTQLNTYAYIGDRTKFNHVDSLFLAYYEPFTDIDISMIESKTTENEMIMSFRPSIVNVEVNPKLIDDSLEKVKEIWEMKTPPKGRDCCDECLNVENIFEILHINSVKDDKIDQKQNISF